MICRAIRPVAPLARGRTFVTRSKPVLGGAHPMWEPGPFDKKTVGITCISMVVGGAGLVWFSCAFQNKKHGFSK